MHVDRCSSGTTTASRRSARADIENVPIERLQAFYRKYYQPGQRRAARRRQVRRGEDAGLDRAGVRPIPKPRAHAAADLDRRTDAGRRANVHRAAPGRESSWCRWLPRAVGADPDSPALDSAADVLGDTPTGRLHQALVDTGKAAQVFAFTVPWRDPGFVLFGAVVKKGEPLEPVSQTMVDVIESFGEDAHRPTPSSKRAQKPRTAYDRTLADPQAFGVGLSEYISLGDWRLFFLHTRPARKPDARQGRLRRGASSSRATTASSARSYRTMRRRAEIPIAPSPDCVLAEYKPSEKGSVGEVFDPTQENIDKRTRLLSFGGSERRAAAEAESRQHGQRADAVPVGQPRSR